MTAIESASRRLALGAFSRVRGGSLELIEPDGRNFTFGEAAADLAATIRVNSARFYKTLLSGSVGLGEAYRDRLWDSDDLVALLRIACRNLGSLDAWRRRIHPLLAPLEKTVWRVPRNSKRASRRHISAHYDLGNDLFALYLDESMMY